MHDGADDLWALKEMVALESHRSARNSKKRWFDDRTGIQEAAGVLKA